MGRVEVAGDRPWRASPGHFDWLRDHARELTAFGRASLRPEGGFWWLDDDGRPDPGHPLHTWIACRMTHVYGLAHLLGEPDTEPLVDHGLATLSDLLRDPIHGGWFGGVDTDGTPTDERKAAYPHSFVVLAASTAVRAGRPGAADLLRTALDVVGERFWDSDRRRTRESWSRDWSSAEPYRGANSSMHMVEAFLAAGDATGDPAWNRRALDICEHLIHDVAAGHDWRLPEHFTEDWQPLLEYNADHPADQFRPYGSTIGHWLEWARLLVHLDSVLSEPPAWLVPSAAALFDAAVRRGWAVDGADGLVYTIGWDDRPVIRSRLHWVVAEGIGAAATLAVRTGEERFDRWYGAFWEFTRRHLIDEERGSWRHELDPENRPAATIWRGKPDVYHAYQATLLPLLPLAPTLAAAAITAGPLLADPRP